MALLKISSVLLLTLASCYATYGPSYKDNYHGSNGGPRKVIVDSSKIHLDGPKIHLDSAKILLDRPSIHVKDSAQAHGLLGDDEPIILENDKPLYIRKSLHGFQAAGPAIILDGNHGHGGYGSGHGYGAGKLFGAPAAIVAAPAPIIAAAPAPIAHDAILVRRPIHVAKNLVPTQDHLERAHLERLILSGGYAHGHFGGGYAHGHPTGTVLTAIPVSKGIQENTVVYERAPIHSVGQGIISYRSYHAAPTAVAVGPAVLEAGHGFGGHGFGYGAGKDIHNGGGYKKY